VLINLTVQITTRSVVGYDYKVMNDDKYIRNRKSDVFTHIGDSGKRDREARSVDRQDPGRSTSVR